ncbi:MULTISPECIES: hypothetical protein [unclassified Streptomyces]|uniref:hypothetical protein n=1 Tax=unclassified Streptomyces TaxID=2593676 RepID=UPI000DC425F3|nr:MULTISPECIES: hypothetical protein [Streptomyces]RAJ60314.1 hypothetical protein K376_02732 [Streptomyces sp. PsTaAH-130]
MYGRPSAPYGHSTARRAVAAAVIAATSLILAANACPARACSPAAPGERVTASAPAGR